MLPQLTHIYLSLIPPLVIVGVSNSAWVNFQETPNDNIAVNAAADVHLTEELLRVAGTAIQSDPLDIDALNAGVVLIELAAEITPDDPDVWRTWVEVAALSDRPEMKQKGTQELLRLFPNEAPLQLARLRDAVDSLNTAAERLDLYEQLIAPRGKGRLSAPVAARLAFDAAMLQRQLGNTQQFARWLAESVALDPYFTEGMAVAVGFFGDESASAYRRVELLTSLMLANLRDVTTQVTLAELLMSFGSYEVASRVYDIALADNAGNTKAINNDLLSDMVISHWAARDTDKAMSLLAKRQRETNEAYRASIRSQDSRVSPLQLARIHSPLAPKLATVKAAILSEGDSVAAADALDSAIKSFDLFINILLGQDGYEYANATAADLCLQSAWVCVWLGNRIDTARESIEQAQSLTRLSQEDIEHLEGWIAMRSGDLETAEKTFSSVEGSNDSSVAGLAMVRLEQGRHQEAATLFLRLARDSAGTLLGVWSRNQLEHILGQHINARGESKELAPLIDDIPSTIDSYVTMPTSTLTVRVTPESLDVGPYEPILLTIELSNNGLLPMQIAQAGPIQPFVLLEVETQIVNAKISSRVPIIVPIDRKLILKPRERFSVSVDLRKHWVGTVFNDWPTRGGMLGMQAITNFTAWEVRSIRGSMELVYHPSTLGSKSKDVQLRVEGIRLTDLWMERAIGQVKEMSTPEGLTSFVLLTYVIGDNATVQVVEPLIPPPPGEEPLQIQEGERHPLQDEAITTLLLAFPSLDVTAKAWVLSVISSDPTFESLVTMADSDENELTTIGWMLRFITPSVADVTLDNTRLISALQDENPRIRIVAKWVYAWVEKTVRRRIDAQFGTPDA